MKLSRFIVLIGLLFPGTAFAGTCNPFPMLDSSGAGAVNFRSALDGSSFCFGFTGLLDGTGALAFPTVAALNDATTNPTTLLVGSLLHGWDATATKWRRLGVVTATDNLLTDVTSINGVTTQVGNGTTGTGTQRVTLASDSTGQVALAAGSAAIGIVTLGAGSAIAGKFGIDQTTPGTTNAVQEIAGTAGGTSTCFVAAAASTNATNCKNAAGQAYLIRAFNTTATVYYLRTYNLSGAPTCSSATGYVETLPIPANVQTGGFVIPQPTGQTFTTGIGFCITGGPTSTDNTNAAAGVFVTVLYK